MYRVMYRLGWDSQNKILHSELGSPKLLEGKITKAVGSYDQFSCTIDPTQEAFSAIVPLTTFITVVRTKPPQRILFEGRVLDVQPTLGSDGTINNAVTAEGLESFLHDSVQPWAEFHNTSPQAFLQTLINQHNSQVESYKQLKLGTITVTNSTDNVYRFTDDTKDTYDNIKEKLIDRLGGEIRVRHESNGLFLDYMPVIGVKSDQPIQLRKNLLSMSQKLDPTGVITVLKPLGAAEERTTAEGETQAVSTPRLTISGVNGGSPFLRDQKLIDQFGIQVGVQTWDEVKTDSILLTKGKEFLANQKPVKQLVQITAVDLSLVGRSAADFWCGNYYDIINPLIGFAQTLRLSAQVIDIVEPKNSTLQAGDQVMSQEQYNVTLRQQIQTAHQFSKNYEALIQGQATEIANLKKTTTALGQEVDSLKGMIGGSYYEGNIIDVSEWQTTIDWTKVVGAGLALAIIRIQHGSTHEDLTYKANIPAAVNAGANYAVYAYFSASSTGDAAVEANDFYNRAKAVIGSGRQPRFWAIDVETVEMGGNVGLMRSGVEAYMDKLNALGVPDNKIVLYIANHLYTQFNLNVGRAAAIWIPSYGANDGTVAGSTKPSHPYDLWQFTSTGSVPGINGNVDMNTDPSDRFKQQFLKKGVL